MRRRDPLRAMFPILVWALWSGLVAAAEPAVFPSHPPTRPLPEISARPLGKGPVYYVDPIKGDNANAGSEQTPWKTISHGVNQIGPGETLALRGGTYFEHVTVNCQGTQTKPITIRSYPGELAVINGGLREFVESPQTAWEPVPDGAVGEFRSKKMFPGLGGTPDGCNVLGNFADSMLPLQGYRWFADLRDNSMAWDVEGKVDGTEGVYCGPGVLYDPETQRIHVRLASTNLKALGDDNYRGETDPRKLPLIIAGQNAGSPLNVRDARWVAFQDLVVCGSRAATISVVDCADLTFDGLNVYGGSSAFGVSGTSRLRVYHTACRGIAAPWTFRGHLKYRAIEARIFSASGWSSTGRENQDFELAYSEFTDCVDGVFIGNVRNVHFHHNLLDNVSDDGIFLTATTDYEGRTHGGGHHLSQNLLSRCLTTFAFGVGHGRQKMTPTGRQTGEEMMIYRNVFDFRRPVHYQLPGLDDDAVSTHGRVTGDHGSPLWEPMSIYQNTIVESQPMRREFYLADLAGSLGGGGRRRLFNNIAVQVEGMPGKRLPEVVVATKPDKISPKGAGTGAVDPLEDLLDDPAKKPAGTSVAPDLKKTLGEDLFKQKPVAPLPIDFQADGNLHWSMKQTPTAQGLFGIFRDSPQLAASKKVFEPGWATHDVVADPQFVRFSGDWKEPMDLSLSSNSPAINAGIALPNGWPDPLRAQDQGRPDLGAIPIGVEPWRVGVRGRLTMFGAGVRSVSIPEFEPVTFPGPAEEAVPVKRQTAALVQGYPAFDGALVEFLLTRLGVQTELLDKVWLDTEDYPKYSLVVIVGDLARAKMEPRQYSETDLERVQHYLEQGGEILMMRAGAQVFASQHGRYGLGQLIGGSNPRKDPVFQIRKRNHPWTRHLDPKFPRKWLNGQNVMSLRQSKGETIIGTEDGGTASLLRVPVGKGQLIYLGWDISASLPHGRESSTVDQEQTYEEQIQILKAILSDVFQR